MSRDQIHEVLAHAILDPDGEQGPTLLQALPQAEREGLITASCTIARWGGVVVDPAAVHHALRQPRPRGIDPEHYEWLDPRGWRDRQNDVWRQKADGLMHTPETAPFLWTHVVKKWGPLRPVPHIANVDAVPRFEALVDAGPVYRVHAIAHADRRIVCRCLVGRAPDDYVAVERHYPGDRGAGCNVGIT